MVLDAPGLPLEPPLQINAREPRWWIMGEKIKIGMASYDD